jgi:RNA polymerase sigma factor (sigma-70 family)
MRKLLPNCCGDALEAYNATPSQEAICLLAEKCHGCLNQRLRFYIRSKVRSKHEAEDLFQQTWHNFLSRSHNGPIGNVKSYIYTIANHLIIEKKNRDGRFIVDGELLENLSDGAYVHAEEGEALELASALKSRLTPRECEAFEKKYNGGFDNHEIAEQMGVNLRRVENLNTDIRRKAQLLLAEKYPHWMRRRRHNNTVFNPNYLTKQRVQWKMDNSHPWIG